MTPIEKAKSVLPLPELMARCGFGDRAKKSARCPFHEDRHNSFSVWRDDGSWHWKCHAGCGAGDEITFLEKHEGLSQTAAVQRFFEMAGANGATSRSPSTFLWQKCVAAFTDNQIKRLAQRRGYKLEFCQWLKKNDLVGLVRGCFAFPVHDHRGNVVAAHVEKKSGGGWFYEPKDAKTRPLIIGELLPGDPVHVFESQWDAFAFLDASGERSGVIITRGSSNGGLVAGLIPSGSTVFAWTQNDKAGENWQAAICANTRALLKRPRIPAPHKDLNDWTRAGATADQLFKAMMDADIVRQAEQSWPEALNSAVITASELRDLQLVPRQKLLGDWFCEGDEGFIFAFRGVGKTWLAVAIARALSTGGKLGPWQAPAPVKVLYVDGEMPPDQMRDRCKGLETSNHNLQLLNHEILFERTGKVLNIADAEVQRAITAHCVSTSVRVVILDNLSSLACGMKENEADSWELVNPWLLDLRRRKIAAVIVHHAGRSGEMRGTSKREDNVFWIIALDDARNNADDKRGARFVSRFTKPSRNTQEEIPALEWHFVTDNGTGEVSISYKETQTLERFMQLIREGVSDCAELAEELKVSKSTISKWAKKMMDAGRLKKTNRKQYEPDDGSEAS